MGVRNAPARYTLRAFRREDSDQQGAIPLKEWNGGNQFRSRARTRNNCQAGGGQSPSDGSREDGVKINRYRSGNGRDRNRDSDRRGFRDAAANFLAGAATAFRRGWRRGGKRLGRRHHLEPDHCQAENEGDCPFHGFNLSHLSPLAANRLLRFARHFLSGLPAALSFLRNLAGSLLKSFRQDLQHSLISWPSCVKT